MKVKAWLAEGTYRANADRVLQRVLDAPETLDELMEITLAADNTAQVVGASMVMGNLGRIQPDWLIPYLGSMLVAAANPVHPAVRRNVLRYLSELPPEAVPQDLQGRAVDLALRITDDTEAAVASRVFAMQVVANFCLLRTGAKKIAWQVTEKVYLCTRFGPTHGPKACETIIYNQSVHLIR